MKNYCITVNGITYDVTVEEKGVGTQPTMAPVYQAMPAQAAPIPAAPVQAVPAPAPSAPAQAAAAGSKKVEAGAAGKVLKLSVKVGDQVKSGDTVAVLEIMKMETPIVTSDEGTVVSIPVAIGDMIEAGAVIATLQ